MNPTIVVLIIVAALVVAGVAWMSWRKRQAERLKRQFGPEYEHQVHEAGGSRAKAEAELLRREKRVEKLDIRPLPAEQRDAYAANWRDVQARFVDDPERAIAMADALVAEVMKARGYPVEDFDQRAADISVDHPHVVSNYRAAHDIAVKRGEGKARTEDLRAAFIGYRSLFEELLDEKAPAPAH
jgi:predicted nucleic acid-binding protein